MVGWRDDARRCYLIGFARPKQQAPGIGPLAFLHFGMRRPRVPSGAFLMVAPMVADGRQAIRP